MNVFRRIQKKSPLDAADIRKTSRHRYYSIILNIISNRYVYKKLHRIRQNLSVGILIKLHLKMKIKNLCEDENNSR